MVDSADPRKWLKRAALDLRGARNNLNDDPQELSQLICYESQQACEKAMKALILSRGLEVPRTHDVSALVRACMELDAMMSIFEPSMGILGRYSTAARRELQNCSVPLGEPICCGAGGREPQHIDSGMRVERILERSPRYPDDLGEGEFSAEQAEPAYAMASAVVEYVGRSIG